MIKPFSWMRVSLIAIFSLLSIQCNKNFNVSTPDIQKQLQQYLDEQEQAGFHGVVLISRGGNILIREGYGMANIADNKPHDPASVLPIGSITKQFTATAILLLESRGKLSTSDPLSAYFTNVPKDKQDIQLHHLLTHTSGLPQGVGDDFEQISKEDFLRRVWSSELNARIGKQFLYSNVGYSLLAMIIEQVSGMPYEAFMVEHIFQPSGMMQTGYTLPNWDREQIAHLYGADGQDNGTFTERPGFPSWHFKGNGGILSTADDMYKWYEVIKSQALLPATSWQKMFTAYKNEYGYGWDVIDKGKLIQHNGGSTLGVSAEFRWFTPKDVLIIHLSNNLEWGNSNGRIRRRLAEIARQ